MAQSGKSGKRASMREGPLADLFRKTEEGEPAESALLDAPEPEAREQEQPAPVPSPQERLRNVFSSEIPENVMEPP
jgi:cell division protein FtsZ